MKIVIGALVFVFYLGIPQIAFANIGLYAELIEGSPSNGSLQLTAYGSAENYDCPPGPTTIDVYLFGPGNNLLASTGYTDWCYASAEASATIAWDQWSDGDYEARATASGGGVFHGCASNVKYFGRFQAVFEYSHYNSFIGKHEYVRNTSTCVGKCQHDKWCSTQQANYLYIKGWQINSPISTFCIPLPPYPQASATQPACIQQFGGWIFWGDNECS